MIVKLNPYLQPCRAGLAILMYLCLSDVSNLCRISRPLVEETTCIIQESSWCNVLMQDTVSNRPMVSWWTVALVTFFKKKIVRMKNPMRMTIWLLVARESLLVVVLSLVGGIVFSDRFRHLVDLCQICVYFRWKVELELYYFVYLVPINMMALQL